MDMKKLYNSCFNYLENLKRDKKGFTGIVVAAVTSLVVGVILLVIGVYIESALFTAMPKLAAGTANTTITAVFAAGYSAFGMGTIIPIVIVAAAIISIIIGAFVYRTGRQ